NYQRKRLWVDPPFQARLLVRMTTYLALFSVVVWHLSFLFETLRELGTGKHVTFVELYLGFIQRQMPLLVAFLLLTPPLLYNLLKFSHRIAGPLFRCRRMMREMAAGEVVPEFKPRQGDLMNELIEAFNELIRVNNARARAAASEAPKEDLRSAVSP